MVNKSTVVAIVLIMVAIGLIFVGVWFAYNEMQANNSEKNQTDQLFVVESGGFYGVMDVDGTAIANIAFKEISRINDVVYLKNDTASYLYNILTKETVALDNKETGIYYVYNSLENTFENNYILKYGSTDESAVYRIIDSKGERVASKDFASISAAYEFLDLVPEENFTPKAISDTVITGTKETKELFYATSDGKSQYVIKADDESGKYGIVNENNEQILPTEYDSITEIKDSTKACIAKKNSKNYVVINTGKVIEIEDGFEAEVNDGGYIVQKLGDTANKIYNFKGEVILDTIFNYPADIAVFDTSINDYIGIKDEKTSVWTLYNLETAEKMETTYTGVVTKYLETRDKHTKNKTLIYSTGTALVGVDLDKLTSYKINIPYTVVAPLESGYKLIVEKEV